MLINSVILSIISISFFISLFYYFVRLNPYVFFRPILAQESSPVLQASSPQQAIVHDQACRAYCTVHSPFNQPFCMVFLSSMHVQHLAFSLFPGVRRCFGFLLAHQENTMLLALFMDHASSFRKSRLHSSCTHLDCTPTMAPTVRRTQLSAFQAAGFPLTSLLSSTRSSYAKSSLEPSKAITPHQGCHLFCSSVHTNARSQHVTCLSNQSTRRLPSFCKHASAPMPPTCVCGSPMHS